MDRKEVKKKKKKFSEHDPEKYIDLEPNTKDSYFREAVGSTVVVSFGRFNPITVGHEKLVSKVIGEALRRKAVPMVFMSHSQDSKKNPLSYDDKIKYGRKAFGKAVIKSNARTIIEVAKQLAGKFDNIVFVAGQDRVKEFEKLLNTYNGKEYSFNNIEVISAGTRDPDAEGVEGMSASKMRNLAQEGNFEEFQKGLPKKLKSSAKQIYDEVRSKMDITEETIEERAQLNVSQRRRRGLIMKRYKTKIAAARRRARRRKASPEKLKLRAQRRALEVIRQRLSKNKSYKDMSPTEKIALDKRLARVPQTVLNRIATRELPKVKRAETERLSKVLNPKKEDLNAAFENFIVEREDPDVGHRKGSQPKNYYKGVAKSVKDDRARHFEKHGKMDDDNPAAYKPAPGDSTAKTKPSQHTKRFKRMFGESLEEASCADMRVRKRPHMAMEKNGSVKFDRRFKMYRSKHEINEGYDDLNEDAANLMLDLDNFVMSEEFDALMESNPKEALKKKAEKSGISYGILKKVFDRGVAAWRTGHRPGTTPTQWGLARVNSFATKSKGTWGKADKDLAAKVRKEEVELDEVSSELARSVAKKRQAQASNLRQKAVDEPDMMKAFAHTKAANKAEKKAGQSYNRLMKKEAAETQFTHGSYKTSHFDICPSAKAAFDKNVKEGNYDSKLIDAAKAVDQYLGIEKDLRDKDEVTKSDLDKMTNAVDVAKEKIEKAGLKGHNYHEIHVDNVKDMMKEVNENEAQERAKERIKAEKERDKMRHDRMLDTAKMRDLRTKLRNEGSEKPSDREWGTDSLTKTYKKDTPGEDLKEESPLMKNLKRGDRVSFRVKKITGEDYDEKGTVVGAWQDDDNFAAKQRLRVRDDGGRLHIVKHEDAEKI